MASAHKSGMTYSKLSEMLEASGAPFGAAEMHGSLCGLICAGGRSMGQQWLSAQVFEIAGQHADSQGLEEAFGDVEEDLWAGLTGVSMEFSPLLPADSESLRERVAALALWCHGFLTGLVLGGVDYRAGIRPDCSEIAEIIADFSEITKADPEGSDQGEEVDEAAYVQLTEYVRVGAQILFETLGSGVRGEAAPVLH
jgi:yecA family protein